MGYIDMNLKKIKVYGKLRQFLGAIAFLKANFEGVEKHMNDQFYKIKMGGRVVTEDFLTMSGQGDIQIIPVATGAGPLVVLGLGIGATAAASAIGGFVAGFTALSVTAATTLVTTIGTTLILQGVTDLLTPTQPASNISQVGGVPIPIIYGSVFTGSVIISAGSDTAQVKRTTNTPT